MVRPASARRSSLSFIGPLIGEWLPDLITSHAIAFEVVLDVIIVGWSVSAVIERLVTALGELNRLACDPRFLVEWFILPIVAIEVRHLRECFRFCFSTPVCDPLFVR